MIEPVAVLTRFSRSLRGEGLSVGTGRVVRFCRAAALLEPGDLYWAGRATLVSRPQDVAVYDRVFAAFFGGSREAKARSGVRVRVTEDLEPEVELALASPLELLRQKSFADCSPDELAQLADLMARVSLAVPLWRERRQRPRRLVLLLDVSGSMADYSRALVMFAHAALRADRRWEAFCFGTRLTRVTRALRTGDHDEALRRASAEVVDWDGGTRIGESLKRFLDDFGHGGMARGAVVVLCSDGLEVGDPVLLAEQMARLSRLAHRVVWLNPLQEDPAYEPLARGMQAALPYVDDFASGHNLASLEAVAERLMRLA